MRCRNARAQRYAPTRMHHGWLEIEIERALAARGEREPAPPERAAPDDVKELRLLGAARTRRIPDTPAQFVHAAVGEKVEIIVADAFGIRDLFHRTVERCAVGVEPRRNHLDGFRRSVAER